MPKYREKSKAFVVKKIAERVPDKIGEDRLSEQVSALLFERDYTTISDILKEYRKTSARSANSPDMW